MTELCPGALQERLDQGRLEQARLDQGRLDQGRLDQGEGLCTAGVVVMCLYVIVLLLLQVGKGANYFNVGRVQGGA